MPPSPASLFHDGTWDNGTVGHAPPRGVPKWTTDRTMHQGGTQMARTPADRTVDPPQGRPVDSRRDALYKPIGIPDSGQWTPDIKKFLSAQRHKSDTIKKGKVVHGPDTAHKLHTIKKG